jgi:S-(hydroxymethyl)glutathione dehydrogenase/alcohol dehydrogenase
VQEVLVEMTDGGVDYAIECCGTVQTMRAAFEACHMGWGVAVAIGLIQAGQEVSFVPYHLCQGRTWKGSSFGGWKGLDAVPKMIEWYMKGEIMVDEFINEYIPLEQINEGFDKLLKGKT